MSGIDRFPSAAWARLDGLRKGSAPVVHISAPGIKPEDGFSGYCLQGILDNLLGECTEGKSRWGDYSASVVDEFGCIWSGVEYISGLRTLDGAGDWSTFVTRIVPEGCKEPSLRPTEKPLTLSLHIAPCSPLFVGEAGSDDSTIVATQGQNPQMDILSGRMSLSRDGK